MSKTWEHYHNAARHHERAAYYYGEAAKYDQAEERGKAAHHECLVHGQNQHAIHHDVEAAKLHADNWGNPVPASAREEKKKSAA
jgi:hypothetical protein